MYRYVWYSLMEKIHSVINCVFAPVKSMPHDRKYLQTVQMYVYQVNYT